MHTPASEIHNPFQNPGELADEALGLDRDQILMLESWAQRAASQPQAGEWQKQGEKLLAGKEAGAVAHYALAALLRQREMTEESAHQLVVLCERLSQVEAWPALALVAERALEIGAGVAAARWWVRAADHVGSEEEVFTVLEKSHELAPSEPRIAWRLAQLYEKSGDRRRALETTARTLDALAKRREVDELDDVLLHLLEVPDRERFRLVFKPLTVFAKSGEVERVADFLGMAWPTILQLELAADAWPALRQMVTEVENPRPFLELLVRAAGEGLPQGEEARRLLRMTEIEHGGDPKEALELFDRLLPFAVGSYAEHKSWGAGRVSDVTPEEVWLDFPERTGHRMTLRAAHQALVPLDADDLAVLSSREPAELERVRQEDPVDLVVRALRRLKGEAETRDIKRLMVHYAIPEKEWTRFWNSARARFPDDPRVDDSQAYQNRYRLGVSGGEPGALDDADLPRFDRRADSRKMLARVRKFLDQHPGTAARLVEKRGAVLRAWRDDAMLGWRERLISLLVLTEGGDEQSETAAGERAGQAFLEGFDLRELPTASEQSRVLEWALASPQWRDAVSSAFSSRFAEVKSRALSFVLETHRDEAKDLFTTLVRGAKERPDAALYVVQMAYGSRASESHDFPRPGPWMVAVGFAGLLESGVTPAQRKLALSLLTTDGELARAAREATIEEDDHRTITRLVHHWRSSDRTLHPFLEWLHAVGLEDPVERVRAKKKEAAQAITAKRGPVSVHERRRPYFTKATYERLRLEAEEIQQALRSTIPAAIQKARELGDLRENAEYESARLKQRQAQARLAQLAERLEDALFIDDLEPRPDTVGLGSEITLDLEDGSERVVWLLGEADGVHGSEVVSYRAPLGKLLLDRRLGESIALPADGSPQKAVIRSIRHRIPEVPES